MLRQRNSLSTVLLLFPFASILHVPFCFEEFWTWDSSCSSVISEVWSLNVTDSLVPLAFELWKKLKTIKTSFFKARTRFLLLQFLCTFFFCIFFFNYFVWLPSKRRITNIVEALRMDCVLCCVVLCFFFFFFFFYFF
jgi:hypothetical protein